MRPLRHLLGLQNARGGEIRVLTSPSQSWQVWQEIPAEWFTWETVISVPWRDPSSHINVAEARAQNLAVPWRARDVRNLNTRFLGLLDSQVNLSSASKGRTNSHRMRHVELRTNAVLLAGHLRDINGYTRSDKNPADAPSRDVKAWQRHHRTVRPARARTASPSMRSSGLQEAARAGL